MPPARLIFHRHIAAAPAAEAFSTRRPDRRACGANSRVPVIIGPSAYIQVRAEGRAATAGHARANKQDTTTLSDLIDGHRSVRKVAATHNTQTGGRAREGGARERVRCYEKRGAAASLPACGAGNERSSKQDWAQPVVTERYGLKDGERACEREGGRARTKKKREQGGKSNGRAILEATRLPPARQHCLPLQMFCKERGASHEGHTHTHTQRVWQPPKGTAARSGSAHDPNQPPAPQPTCIACHGIGAHLEDDATQISHTHTHTLAHHRGSPNAVLPAPPCAPALEGSQQQGGGM